MEGIITRFVKLREEYGPTQGKFGKLFGLTDVSISRMESGQTPISEKHIKSISGVLGINENWLRSGEGPVYKSNKVSDEDAMREMFRAISPEGRKSVLDYINYVLEKEKKVVGEIVGEDKRADTSRKPG